VRLGRNRPDPARVERQPTFKSFRTTSPIVVPDGFDFGALCIPALETMLANGPDPTAPPQVAARGLGDCTCACVGHAIDIWTAGGDSPVVITATQVVTLYSLACGYVLGDPSTDNGGNELAVLDYVQANGIDGNGLHKLAGTASLDATNVQEMKEGTFLTGASQLCLELPDAYTNAPTVTDTVWDIAGAPNPSQGHCVLCRGTYTTNCPNGKPAWGIITWGTRVWYTTDACAYYSDPAQGGSVNLAVTQEWIDNTRGTSPNALNWAAMQSAFQALGGQVSS
jgi:hypothetical protein